MDKITEKIIGCACKLGNAPGSVFLEKVYENALVHELKKSGVDVEQHEKIEVHYDGIIVGVYTADLTVNLEVFVELKCVSTINEIHLAQCLNYLKITEFKVCLLINFGTSKVEMKRVVRGF